MATIPRISEQRVSPTALPASRVNAPIDQSAQMLGGATTHASDQAARIFHQEAEQAARIETIDADRQASQIETQLKFDPQNGALLKQGKNAFDLPTQVLPQFDQQMTAIENGIKSQSAKLVFKQEAVSRRGQLLNSLEQHEATQRQKFYDDTDNAYLEQSQKAVALDPSTIDTELARQSAVLKTTAQRKGWDDAVLGRAVTASHEDSYTGAIQQLLASKRTAQAAALYEKAKGTLSPVVSAKVESAIRTANLQQQSSLILSKYQTGTTSGDRALTQFERSDAPDEVKLEVRRAVNSGLDQMRDEKQRLYVKDIASLHSRIATDQVTANDEEVAWDLYQKGAYTPAQYSSALSGIATARLQAAEKFGPITAVSNAFDHGIALDPADAKLKKAANLVFQAQVRSMQPGGDDYVNTAVEWAKRTNIVPEAVISWARTVVSASAGEGQGDPDQVAKATDALARIEERAPQAYSFIEDPKLRAFADQVNGSIRAGAPARQAVEIARKNVFELTEAQRKAYEEQFKKNFKPGVPVSVALTDDLQHRLNGDDRYDQNSNPFRGAPQVPVGMGADYTEAVNRYYSLMGGDLKKAQEAAYKDLTHLWGYTTVNGAPQLMKNAPETRWPVTAEAVRTDIHAAIQQALPQLQAFDHTTGSLGPANPTADQVKLVPSDLTDRSHGMSWWLGFENQYGDLDFIRDQNGRPIDYRLPVAPAELHALAAADSKMAVDKARAINQQRLQHAQVLEDLAKQGDEDAERVLLNMPAGNESVH